MLNETWTYAGLREKGKKVHWVCPNGEVMSFGASKVTKAIAVGSEYEISNVKRDSKNSVESASFGNKKWVSQKDRESEEVREWALNDKVARQYANLKRTENKIKKANDEELLNMTVAELQQLANSMNRSERSILSSIVLGWLM